MLEKVVLKQCKEHLESLGWIVFKHYGSPYSTKGFPDLFGCTKNHLFFAIEIKTLGNKPNDNQAAFIAWLQEKGAIAFYADSLEMLKDKLLTYIT